MKRDLRLRSSSAFRAVLAEGRSVTGDGFVLYYAPRQGQHGPRFGSSVSRRIGGAVVRNRVKRLLREAVRPLLLRFTVPADVVVVARPAILGMGLSELRQALADAAARAELIRLEEGTST